jgi:hypothetical protein
MTSIISIEPPSVKTALHLVSAAWNFSHAVLWAEQPIDSKEKERAKKLIAQHLNYPLITKRAFIDYCERILLTHDLIAPQQSLDLPRPSLWLHPSFSNGFSETSNKHNQLIQQRELIPGYRDELHILSSYYHRYTMKSDQSCITACRKRLIVLKAHSLLSTLYRVAIYSNFSY